MPGVLLKWTHEEIRNLQTGVVCEMWEKRLHGRIRREYLKAFTLKERDLLRYHYKKIYDWNFRRGIPFDGVVMTLKSYDLIKRAANFFGTV